MFLGDKSEALRLDEKQHGGKKQVERHAKIRNPINLKLQTPNRKLQFVVCDFPRLAYKSSSKSAKRNRAPC